MPFEDLIWLFTSDAGSRGIVRLNIAEGALLYKYCKKKRNGILLEIGRKYGGSTVLMASSLCDGSLYSIDIKMHNVVSDHIGLFKDKVHLITGDSKIIQWKMPVDLLFIDGDHSYQGVKNDVNKFTPHITAGGYVIFHDVVGKKSVLQPIISGLLKKDYIKSEHVDSMLVLQKTGSIDD